MESQMKDDPPRKPDQPDPKPADHAPDGDGRSGDSSSVVPGSESQAQNQSESEEKVAQAEQSLNRTSSVSKKSVRWSPDLVTETPAGNQSSNSYVVPSPASSLPFSMKGNMRVSHTYIELFMAYTMRVFLLLLFLIVLNWNRYDGECEGSAGEMGKEDG